MRITVLVGMVLLVAELFSLLLLQTRDKELCHHFYSNALEYAGEGPMPVIFGITIAVIAAGAALAVGSILVMRGRKP